MLRLANSSRSYDVTVTVAGELIRMKLRSTTVSERVALLHDIANSTPSSEGFPEFCKNLARVIDSIEGYPEPPAQVLERLEHQVDLDTIAKAILNWLTLNEQESKNLDSSPARSTPAPDSTGSAATTVGVENGPASTTPEPTEA